MLGSTTARKETTDRGRRAWFGRHRLQSIVIAVASVGMLAGYHVTSPKTAPNTALRGNHIVITTSTDGTGGTESKVDVGDTDEPLGTPPHSL